MRRSISLIVLPFASVFVLQQHARAEGSIDINKLEGSKYYRLYLEWAPTSPMAVTSMDNVPSTNKIFVYVETGESLLLASSNLNAIGGSAGAIRYTKPDGVTTTTLTGPGTSGSSGFIANRLQEKQGPYGLYNAGVGGYTPFAITADQTGIWVVEFISQTPLSADGTAGGPRLTTANWPANQKRCTAAWDATVVKAGNVVSGRAFAKWLPLNPGGYTASGSFVTASPELFVKTRDGILYRWQQKGYAGYGHSLFSNNSGILDNSLNRMFESMVYQGIPLRTDRRLHSPAYADNDSLFANKMFFNTPDATMPQFTQLGSEPNHWLNPVYNSNPATFFYTGLAALNPMEGNFTVHYPTVQRASIIVDCNEDHIYGNANDRQFDFYTRGGATKLIYWDGLDGTGAVLPRSCYLARLLLQNGEVHFPMLDIENNFEGIVLERLNGPGTLPDYTVHWDDRPLNDNNETPAGSYLKNTPAGGISSLLNGHRWASAVANGNTITHSTAYGDARLIDTWSYAITTANAVIYTACGVLPVQLKEFSGRADKEGNRLSWEVANNNSTAVYNILKSSDGINFKRIGTVESNKQPEATSTYSFTDPHTTGTAYYKLQIIGREGVTNHSKVLVLHRESAGPGSATVYPNPASTGSKLVVNAKAAGTGLLHLYTASGLLVDVRKIRLATGMNEYALPELATRPDGVYLIRVATHAGEIYTVQFNKRE